MTPCRDNDLAWPNREGKAESSVGAISNLKPIVEGEKREMNKRKLGRSGLEAAPLAFGGNVFGWTVDEPTSFRLLDALELLNEASA